MAWLGVFAAFSPEGAITKFLLFSHDDHYHFVKIARGLVFQGLGGQHWILDSEKNVRKIS